MSKELQKLQYVVTLGHMTYPQIHIEAVYDSKMFVEGLLLGVKLGFDPG